MSILFLLVVHDCLRAEIVHFQLCRHLLQAGGKGLTLLSQLRDSRSLFLYDLVLLKELIEQHSVNLLVADGDGFSIPAHHELGIHLGNVLGDQTILRRTLPVTVELKGDWFESVQRFTRLVHWLNVALVLPRGVEDANHIELIDKYCFLGANIANWLIKDAAN